MNYSVCQQAGKGTGVRPRAADRRYIEVSLTLRLMARKNTKNS